jgi:hypothetical protein
MFERGARCAAAMGIALSFMSILPVEIARGDAFTERATRSYAQDQADREAGYQRSADTVNIRLIKKVIATEKRNGGVNSSMKCYSESMDFRDLYMPVEWSARGYQTTIYSRRSLWGQKLAIGSATASIATCHFETNNGFACSVGYPWDDPSVDCYNSNHVRYEERGGRLVRYVAPAESDDDSTPIAPCDNARLDQASAEASCRNLNHSRERDACLAAVPALPSGCQ